MILRFPALRRHSVRFLVTAYLSACGLIQSACEVGQTGAPDLSPIDPQVVQDQEGFQAHG